MTFCHNHEMLGYCTRKRTAIQSVKHYDNTQKSGRKSFQNYSAHVALIRRDIVRGLLHFETLEIAIICTLLHHK